MSFEKRFSHYLAYSGLQSKEYQIEGVRWCVANETQTNECGSKKKGGFIADEMGLGKTILMIGTMAMNILPNTLIVLPPVLIEQWRQQIRKTTGYEPLVYHGTAKKKIDMGHLLAARIVLTSYCAISIRKCDNEKSLLLHNVAWSRIIFDEAHHLRNRGARFYGACNLKSGIRWLVTGTPIQNKKRDFYNLCEVLGMSRSFYTDLNNASSFLLKRTKKQVGIQLPDVVCEKTMVHWTNSRERELFEEVHSTLKFTNIAKNAKRLGIQRISRGTVLTNILRARQMSVMPKLLTSCMNLYENDHYAQGLTACSKLNSVVASILSNRDNGAGKLVFCMFKEEIDEVYSRLLDGGMMNVACLDGRTGKEERLAALSDNNEVLILQVQTGCEGLNLQENYSEIYFVTPHWNPAIEDQAIARCHRIGQTKNVIVRRFEMSVLSTLEKCGAVSPSVVSPTTSLENNPDSNDEQLTMEGYVNNVQKYKRYLSEQILGSS